MQEPTEESPAAPDSTTKERSGFSEGEDVLFQRKDGRFYLGTIVEVSPERMWQVNGRLQGMLSLMMPMGRSGREGEIF